MKNTIIIEDDAYKREIKYFWKNGNGTLSDLSEMNSPFSRAKPQYKEFSKAALADIAFQVIKTIDETYNHGDGLHIEVNGIEDDYIAIKNTIEEDFPGKHMDCKWKKRMESSTEAMKNIKKIYYDLHKALSECDDEGCIEVCNENDPNGWLRFGFDRENVTSGSALYSMCGMAGDYLGKIIQEIKTETENKINMIDILEKELEKERQKSTEMGKMMAHSKLPDMMNKICKEKKKEFGRQFEGMLNDSFMEKYLDESRIAGRIKAAVRHADEHRNEWTKSEHEMDFIEELLNASNRKKYIEKTIAESINEDVNEYTAEINTYGESFWNQKSEELKKALLESVYTSDNYTEKQKEIIRQCVTVEWNTQGFCGIVNADRRGEEAFDEKTIGREYRKQLEKKLRAEKKMVLDTGKKVPDKWTDELNKTLENIESDTRVVVENLEKGLKECKRKRDMFSSLQDRFIKGRNKIEAVISVR